MNASPLTLASFDENSSRQVNLDVVGNQYSRMIIMNLKYRGEYFKSFSRLTNSLIWQLTVCSYYNAIWTVENHDSQKPEVVGYLKRCGFCL